MSLTEATQPLTRYAIKTRAKAAVCLLIAFSASVAAARRSTADVNPGRSLSAAAGGPFACLDRPAADDAALRPPRTARDHRDCQEAVGTCRPNRRARAPTPRFGAGLDWRPPETTAPLGRCESAR